MGRNRGSARCQGRPPAGDPETPCTARRSKRAAGAESPEGKPRIRGAASSLPVLFGKSAKPCGVKVTGTPAEFEEELWEHVWLNVEADRRFVHVTAPPVAKRRRLVAKTPPELAIVVYRRRLVGKQPDPATAGGRTKVAHRGHYDVLGLRREASMLEVHAAYRRRALRTHPDKGGDPAEFHRVAAAFEELADEARRAAYDRSLAFFGRRDGLAEDVRGAAGEEAEDMDCSSLDAKGVLFAARVVRDKSSASTCTPDDAARMLAGLDASVLDALQGLLNGTRAKPKKGGSTAASQRDTSSSGRDMLRSLEGQTCITQQRGGFKVAVNWSNLSVTTCFTMSLTDAIDWQIALLQLRGTAQERMRRCKNKQEPLLESEVAQALRLEPAMELSFEAVVHIGSTARGPKGRRAGGDKGGRKVSSPAVYELATALDFRRRLLALASVAPTRQQDVTAKALDKERRQLGREAAAAQARRAAGERRLRAALVKELRSRLRARQICNDESTSSKRGRKDVCPATVYSARSRKRNREQIEVQVQSKPQGKQRTRPSSTVPSRGEPCRAAVLGGA